MPYRAAITCGGPPGSAVAGSGPVSTQQRSGQRRENTARETGPSEIRDIRSLEHHEAVACPSSTGLLRVRRDQRSPSWGEVNNNVHMTTTQRTFVQLLTVYPSGTGGRGCGFGGSEWGVDKVLV